MFACHTLFLVCSLLVLTLLILSFQEGLQGIAKVALKTQLSIFRAGNRLCLQIIIKYLSWLRVVHCFCLFLSLFYFVVLGTDSEVSPQVALKTQLSIFCTGNRLSLQIIIKYLSCLLVIYCFCHLFPFVWVRQ